MNRYRQTAIKRNLTLRARILAGIRDFFFQNDYLEVETSLRVPGPTPEAHIDAVASEGWFLHTSPEMCMKRLLAAGYERIFQICKCFRKSERGKKHLPEMTLLEWYHSGFDYHDMMDQCEDLLRFLVRAVSHKETIEYQGHHIDLNKGWQRLTVAEAFRRYASISMQKALRNNRFDEVIGYEIEPKLGYERPVFLYDYPAERGALARPKTGDPSIVERCELYIGGLELCNAFSELTDPVEQRKRFQAENEFRNALQKDVYPIPVTFLEALSDVGETAGNALGVDRLVMLFADTGRIDDVVAFIPEEL